MEIPVIAYLIPYLLSAGTSAAIGAYALGNLIVAWGLYRYRLFDLVSVSLERLAESLRDAVIVINLQNRIVDLNLAAIELIRKMDTVNRVGKLATLELAPYRRRIENHAVR